MPVDPNAGVAAIEATGGNGVGEALVVGDALDPLLALADPADSGAEPPAVEVTVVVEDSEPLLHPASSATRARIAITTVRGALFRAASIVVTALSQDFRGQDSPSLRQPIGSGQPSG
jgi:hypothetical protein